MTQILTFLGTLADDRPAEDKFEYVSGYVRGRLHALVDEVDRIR